MRFKGFTEEWNLGTIKSYGYFYYGKSAPKWSVTADAKTPCVRYGELYTRDLAKIDTVKSYTSINTSDLVFSTGNEVLVPRVGEDPMDFYKCAYLPLKNVAIGEMISVYNTKQNPLFVTYYFRGKMRKAFAKKVEGGNVSNLYYTYLEDMMISVPTLAEQKIIAEFLHLIDNRIITQNKIIKELELLKKRISKNLFSLTPLKYERLKSYYTKGKAGGTPSSTNRSFYNGCIPFLSISDITEQGKYITHTEKHLSELGVESSSAWIVPINSLILSMYASVGLVAINKVPLATSQAMFSMVIKNVDELDYLYYYLSYFKEYKMHKYLETGTQSNINADMVQSIEIPDYGKTENIRITNTLKAVDEKLQKEKDILSLYKKQKAYLLKNLFI